MLLTYNVQAILDVRAFLLSFASLITSGEEGATAFKSARTPFVLDF
jgi:hypothetical protein